MSTLNPPIIIKRPKCLDSKIQLYWQVHPNNPVETTSYIIRDLNVNPQVEIPVSVGKVTYLVTGLTNGTAYHFEICATDGTNKSSFLP